MYFVICNKFQLKETSHMFNKLNYSFVNSSDFTQVLRSRNIEKFEFFVGFVNQTAFPDEIMKRIIFI